MSDCTNKKLGEKLYAYEIGMLDGKEREEFEIHLIECQYCKNRALKFDRAAYLIKNDPELREIVTHSDTHTVPLRKPRTKIIRFAIAAAAVFVLLILKPWQIEFRSTHEAIAEENRLAVMYFENLVAPDDPQRLGEILCNLLITDISQSQYINVVSSQRLYDVIKLLGYDNSGIFNKDIATRVAENLHVKWTLIGSIVQIDPQLIFTSQLIEVASGNVIASHRIAAQESDDIFSLVDKLTIDIRNDLALPEAAANEDDQPIADVTTHSTEAFHYFLEGISNLNKMYKSDAVKSFHKALAYDSTFAMAYYYLAQLDKSEYISEALKYSDKIGQKEKLYIQSSAAMIAGDEDLGIKILEELLQRYPEEKKALYTLAEYQFTKKQYSVAIELYNKILKIDPLYKSAWNELVYAYQSNGEYEKALKAADRYIEIAGDEPNPYDTKAEILAKNGQVEQAIDYYRKVLLVKPDFSDYSAAFSLGWLLLYNGDYEQAHKTFQEVVIHGERYSRSKARTLLAAIPYYRGKFKEALEILDEGIAADNLELATAGQYGDRSHKHFIKSMIYVEKGDLTSATREIASAIEIHNRAFSNRNPSFRCMYVEILAKNGDYIKAEEITEIIKTDYLAGIKPAESGYWYALGSIELSKGNNDRAVSDFEKATNLNPSYDFNIILAKAYLLAGNYNRAIETYNDLLTDYSSIWRLYLGISAVKAYFYLGLAYEETGKYDNAIQQYNTFLNIWKDADEGIKEIEEAKTRLLRLENKS